MTNPANLKKELESFKSQIREVNKSMKDLECQLRVEHTKIHCLNTSFAHVVKLINHELIESFDNASSLIEELANK